MLLLIAGEGPERSFLQQLVRDLELERHVHFLGSISQQELRHYYSEADVFLMAGRETPEDVEGFGLVYLEANACGPPVVGARVGGVPDAVWDEETGLLVPPDVPSATADALLRLVTAPDLARRLGERDRGAHRSQLGPCHRPNLHAAQPGDRLSALPRSLRLAPRASIPAPSNAIVVRRSADLLDLSGPNG